MILYQKKQLGGALKAGRKYIPKIAKWGRKQYDQIMSPNKPQAPVETPAQPNAFDDYFAQPAATRQADVDAFQGMPRAGDQYNTRLGEIDQELESLATQWGNPRSFDQYNQLRHERDMLKKALGIGL